MKLSIHSILTNKYVLYLIAFLSLLQVFTYIYRNQLDSVIVYMLIAYIVYTFTRNMIIVLGIPLFILRVTKLFTIEGFEENDTENDTENNTENTTNNTKKSTNNYTKTNTSNEIILPESESETETDSNTEADQEYNPNSSDDTTHESSNIESIDNVNPANYASVQDESIPPNTKPTKHTKSKQPPQKNKVNYATTYMSNLKKYNDILGNDGLYKMTEHTKDLMQQQNKLGESIAKIVPLIQQMTPFLKTAGQLFNGNNTSTTESPSK